MNKTQEKNTSYFQSRNKIDNFTKKEKITSSTGTFSL